MEFNLGAVAQAILVNKSLGHRHHERAASFA
jgi:hypothetical protein